MQRHDTLPSATTRANAMLLPRRQFLHLAAGVAAQPAVSRFAWAQAYPERPVRLIVGFAPAGATDIMARLIAQWLSERFGQQFIIENRPGASSNIGTEVVVKLEPWDGQHAPCGHFGECDQRDTLRQLQFQFHPRHRAGREHSSRAQVMEVHPSVPVKTVPEFIAYAKANPGKINLARPAWVPDTISGELFKMMTGVNIVHVPYRGAGPALVDLIGGEVQVMFATMSSSIEYVRTGKLRALAVTTATRADALPDVPTVSDFVPGYEASFWSGVGAPKNTPGEIVDTLNKAINAGLADPKMKARFAELGVTVLAGSPADFSKFIADETEKSANVVRFSGAKAD